MLLHRLYMQNKGSRIETTVSRLRNGSGLKLNPGAWQSKGTNFEAHRAGLTDGRDNHEAESVAGSALFGLKGLETGGITVIHGDDFAGIFLLERPFDASVMRHVELAPRGVVERNLFRTWRLTLEETPVGIKRCHDSSREGLRCNPNDSCRHDSSFHNPICVGCNARNGSNHRASIARQYAPARSSCHRHNWR
jgi:hypothetical protein